MEFFLLWIGAAFALAALITYESRLLCATMAFTSFLTIGTLAMAVM